MTLEKLEGRRNLRARHGSRLTVSSLHGLHVYTESEAKEVCWFTWRSLECPSTSRTLFSGLRVSAHGKQVAPLFGQVLTDFARGGRRANSSPGPARAIWNKASFNKLKEIEPRVNNHRSSPKLSRREEIVLTRLRIGHTRITHSYLFNREVQPFCFGCNTPFTVKHVLLDCADY